MQALSRRSLLFLGAATGALNFMVPDRAWAALPSVVAFRQPGCGCCEVWAKRMTEAGFSVTMTDDPQLDERRRKLGVPPELAGCHLAQIGSYLFEGHVPPSDIIEFLKQQPDAFGLFVPGMPMGSPGMEMGGQTEPYEVVMVGIDGSRSVFARH